MYPWYDKSVFFNIFICVFKIFVVISQQVYAGGSMFSIRGGSDILNSVY